MSTIRDDLQPGDTVYRPYTPTFYGVILKREIRTLGTIGETPFYLVRWKDKTEEWHWYLRVNSLDALISDHEKALNNHRKRQEKARKL